MGGARHDEESRPSNSRRGVRVNSIHPGLIETDMLGQLPTDLDRITRNVPMGRTAAASEVASVALFLACEAAPTARARTSSSMADSTLEFDVGAAL